MDLNAIRAAMAKNLAGIKGLQTSPHMLSNPTPPTAHIYPGDIEFDKTMGRGSDLQTLTVQVLVGLVSDKGAQSNLDAYMAGSGARSVKEKLESDTTLGGHCYDLRVTGSTGYRQIVFPEGRGPLLGTEFRVEVYGHGS